MTVREFCEKYEISHQAVYKKMKKFGNQLDGHIYKKGCLQLDDYAVSLMNRTMLIPIFFQRTII